MFPVAFILIATSLYLVNSAIKNRGPLTTLREVLTDPANVRDTLTGAEGTLAPPLSPSDPGFVGPTIPTGPTAVQGPIVGGATAAAVVNYARAQIGKPYRWGATGPDSFDCSGLIYAAYKSAGITIPRVTATQIIGGKRVAKKDLQAGDLIFPYPGHVFMYIGGGQCIEAPRTGKNVQYTRIYQFMTARRYL